MTTFAEARDDVIGLLKTVWDAGASGKTMLYTAHPEKPPVADDAWAHCSVQHTDSQTYTLGGETGNRRFRRQGTLFVSLYAPVGDGFTSADTLAKVVADGLEGKSTTNGVLIRSVRMQEQGVDGAFEVTNLSADFEYYEVK